jgi:hypothetical protein
MPVAAGDGNPRAATYQVPAGVRVYGGFAGTETSLANRAGLFTLTILSGGLGTPGASGDNAYHVISHVAPGFVLVDGFSILYGNADGTGGFNSGSAGGALVNGQGAILRLVNCFVRQSLGQHGGALAAHNLGTLEVKWSRISSNAATVRGGAVYGKSGQLRVHNLSANPRRRRGALEFDRRERMRRESGHLHIESSSRSPPAPRRATEPLRASGHGGVLHEQLRSS